MNERMKWTKLNWNEMKRDGTEWNGTEWNEMKWTGMNKKNICNKWTNEWINERNTWMNE